MKKNKNKIRSLVLGIFVFSFLFLSTEQSLAAGCCVRGEGDCFPADKEADCLSSQTWYDKSCGEISDCTSANTSFPNPIGFTTVADLLSAILTNLMGIIAFIAVIFVVLGGIMYMMAAGDEKMVTRAKKTWTGAVIGFAIALATPTFLKEIQSILGGNKNPQNPQQWVDDALTIKQISENVLTLLLSVIGIIAVISLVIGGGMYLTAYGDEKKLDKGKGMIQYAIIGIVISLGSLIVVKQVYKLLGGT